jgi:hypothetical protein
MYQADVNDIAEALGASIEDTQAGLASIDHKTIALEHSARFVPGVWDKVSAINECPAEQVLASLPFTPDAVAIVTDTFKGQVGVLQGHTPGVPGFVPMSEAVALAFAEGAAATKAVAHARTATIDAVRAAIEAARVAAEQAAIEAAQAELDAAQQADDIGDAE